MMSVIAALFLLLLVCQNTIVVQCDDKAARILIDSSFANADVEKLYYLSDTFGPRWPGTTAYTQALDWILATMKNEGLENVRGEPVPNIVNWIRGTETLTLIKPRTASLALLGLGNSVGTGPNGITAPVLVVSNFTELTQRAAEAVGKIVVFNAPFVSYEETVMYRFDGANQAAAVGALAALVRSVTPYSLYTPHTGGMSYRSGINKIPTAAITVEDSELLARMQARGQAPVVTLYMEAHTGTPVTERNIIAEVKGSVYPDEIVLLGGHSDCWDITSGAVDDGGGLYSAWDSLRIINDAVRAGTLARPKRTIRVVLWANEELGVRGGTQYRETHLAELSKHVVAFESDTGNFWPIGFGLSDARNNSANAPLLTAVKEALSYIAVFGAGNLTVSSDAGTDTDNGRLYPDVPCMTLNSAGFEVENGDPRSAYYFNYHHTRADSVTALNPEGLKASVAAFAVVTYYIANM